ncbi:hypothetical protein DNFV4_01499 [Nitrospira tepida]|uniref:Uncharacterized protein n=1 Tax=Nitrospira tepida TaxID=2973512 RepID=A0AA86MXV1_9BACT|nr:hypothetical protein [Nitrospira tepida]CAI4031068.1 hypothetical protein DNFV4_01499 [Nitrospira tepida]
MAESDLEKLLGGFAADTLTPEERQRLFTAALRDQQLFNALADEQALKELLADPAVRRRLLQALEQSQAGAVGGGSSWLEWLRRPAGLAWGGGLAAAALAVVLGTKIYQDSLREAAQSVPSETPEPAVRSTPAPPPRSPLSEPDQEPQERVESAPMAGMAKRDARSNKKAAAEKPVAPPASVQDKAAVRQGIPKRTEPAGMQSGKPVEQQGPPVAADEHTHSLAPAAPIPRPMPQTAEEPPALLLAEEVGARARFYAVAPMRGARRAPAKEQRRSATETQSLADRPALEPKQQADAGAVAAPATKPVHLLGLRYSFVVTGSDGRNREVDAVMAANSGGRARLTLEANQDGYLQVLATIGSEEPRVLFPAEQTAQPFAPVTARNRIEVPLPSAVEGIMPATLTVRLSRTPFDSGDQQKRTASGRTSSDLLVESVSPGGPGGPQEQAVYAVSQDLSSASDLSIEIPLNVR